MPGQGARRPTARHSTGAEPFAGLDGGGVAAVPIGLGVGLAGAAELMRIHSHPGGTYGAGWAREKKSIMPGRMGQAPRSCDPLVGENSKRECFHSFIWGKMV